MFISYVLLFCTSARTTTSICDFELCTTYNKVSEIYTFLFN